VKLELLFCRPETPRPGRPPLLFVHGSYCAAWAWESLMPRLAAAGRTCRALSLRGHGGSEGDATFAGLADYVADVEAALDHLGEPCVLIGHSMGGLIVQQCLGRPGRVAGLVLMASVPPSGLSSIAWFLGATSPDLLACFGMVQALGSAAVSEAMVRRAFLSPAAPSDGVETVILRLQAESQRICADLMLPPPAARPPGGAWPPTLVLGGDEDRLVPIFALHETAHAFDADLEVLAGAPHGLMLDPLWVEPTAARLLAWLDSRGL